MGASLDQDRDKSGNRDPEKSAPRVREFVGRKDKADVQMADPDQQVLQVIGFIRQFTFAAFIHVVEVVEGAALQADLVHAAVRLGSVALNELIEPDGTLTEILSGKIQCFLFAEGERFFALRGIDQLIAVLYNVLAGAFRTDLEGEHGLAFFDDDPRNKGDIFLLLHFGIHCAQFDLAAFLAHFPDPVEELLRLCIRYLAQAFQVNSVPDPADGHELIFIEQVIVFGEVLRIRKCNIVVAVFFPPVIRKGETFPVKRSPDVLRLQVVLKGLGECNALFTFPGGQDFDPAAIRRLFSKQLLHAMDGIRIGFILCKYFFHIKQDRPFLDPAFECIHGRNRPCADLL